MLPHNKRGEKQHRTGRRSAREWATEGGGRESAENLKTLTVSVLSIWMSPLFTSCTLSFQCSHNKTRRLSTARWKQRRRRKARNRTHTHTHTLLCFYRRRGGSPHCGNYIRQQLQAPEDMRCAQEVQSTVTKVINKNGEGGWKTWLLFFTSFSL